MRRTRSPLVALVGIIAFLAGGTALAQSCAGFGDVAASSTFCPSVEWMKNRGVTTGCGTGSTYCPDDAVTRVSMAAFMKRLGDALTPVDLAPAVQAGSFTPSANPVLCQSAAYPVTGFPRRAYVAATTVLSAPSAAIDVRAQVVYSTNGGTTWTFIGNSDQYATLYPGATPANHTTLAPFASLDLAVGQTVRFGVQLGQFAGAGSVTASCVNRVQIANRNGATPPLDAAPAAAQRTRGG